MRILIVQTAFLGDVVLTTPLLREIRRAHPAGQMHVLCTATGAAVLSEMAEIDRLWTIDKRWSRVGLLSFAGSVRQLRSLRFDVAIAAQRSVRTGLLIRASGVQRCVGFSGAAGAFAYHHHVVWDPQRHAARRYLDLAAPIGGDPATADPRPRLAAPPRALAAVESLLLGKGVTGAEELLCIAPGSVWPTKRWTAAGFAAVVAAGSRLGLVPVLLGTLAERALCSDVARLSGARVIVLAGETGAGELMALLSRARAFVGNDSGAGHVAAAVGTPVVTLFGPTVPQQGYGPAGPQCSVVEHEGLSCRPCSRHGGPRCPLGHFRCMREIPADRVVGQLAALIEAERLTAAQPLPVAAG